MTYCSDLTPMVAKEAGRAGGRERVAGWGVVWGTGDGGGGDWEGGGKEKGGGEEREEKGKEGEKGADLESGPYFRPKLPYCCSRLCMPPKLDTRCMQGREGQHVGEIYCK